MLAGTIKGFYTNALNILATLPNLVFQISLIEQNFLMAEKFFHSSIQFY